jgi:hypothetical protein
MLLFEIATSESDRVDIIFSVFQTCRGIQTHQKEQEILNVTQIS